LEDGFEGVCINPLDVPVPKVGLGGVLWGVVVVCWTLTLALGLGEVRLMEGEVYVDRVDGDFPGVVVLLRGGVMEVILDLTTVGSAVIDLATVVFEDM
jgi:hypothetical protein